MRIQHNIMAMNAYRNYNTNANALSKNLEKLSSGYRINRAGDDAAGLAISEKMRAQITGLDAAQKNVQDGISLVKTAEGAMQEVQDMLNRMVYLATQSANGTYDSEVDRANLQKEVNSLRSEIDRIADSSNFNGIKLLDGSLGLNETAFTVGEAGGVDAVAAQTIELTFGTVDGSVTGHIGGETKNQVAPSFSVDLANYTLKKADAGTGANNSTVSVAVGGVTLTSGDLADNADADAGAIIDSIIGNYANWAAKGKTANSVIIQGAEFVVGKSGTELTFTYAGMNANTTPAATDEFNSTVAGNINTAIGSAVTVTATPATGVTETGAAQHNTLNVIQAAAKETGDRAGIDITLDNTVVADGNVLTIDGKEFIFKTDANSDVEAADGQQLIDVSGFDTDAEKIHAAVDKLSTFATTNFDIEAKNGTTIHIDQNVGSTAVYDTEAKLKAVASAKTPATGSGTALTIADNSKIAEGNSLVIGGKEYTFGSGADQVAIGDTAADTLANLQAALEADGIESAIDGSTLNIYTPENATAPISVTGGGLTLQIGDTSDSYNQLNVSVEDMHCTALGISGIDISTQEGAAAAVNKIKDAINSVSSTRGDLGAIQNRLEHTANNLSVMEENIQNAESAIRDTDIADEMTAYTKNNILLQSAQAMLAQANQVPQGVLQLLG